MQNMAMIEQERQRMAPLVEEITDGLQPEESEAIAGMVLNRAVSIRRGLACGRGVTGLCIDCTEIGAADTPICEFRTQRILIERENENRRMRQSVNVPGTTLFTVDV